MADPPATPAPRGQRMSAPRGERIIMIPARYDSTRFAGKPLAMITGANGQRRSLIERTWRTACHVPGIDRVLVATDDPRIADVVQRIGAEVVMTPSDCRNGTERCAAVLAQLPHDPDLIINVQGDAPLTPAEVVTALIARMDADPQLALATPAVPCTPGLLASLIADQCADRVGGTTVVFDRAHRALYFSKRVIPFVPADRPGDAACPVHLHLGVYAYRPAALRAYALAPPSLLEELEGLEQLRFCDMGVTIGVALCDCPDWDVIECNNPPDIALIEAVLTRRAID